MQYYLGIESIIFQCDRKGLRKNEQYLLKKMDGTYSTEKN